LRRRAGHAAEGALPHARGHPRARAGRRLRPVRAGPAARRDREGAGGGVMTSGGGSSSGIVIGLEPTADVNPFPGLRPFEPDEDYVFFRRERQTVELLRRLRTTRFLSILGRSGSGKSSL